MNISDEQKPNSCILRNEYETAYEYCSNCTPGVDWKDAVENVRVYHERLVNKSLAKLRIAGQELSGAKNFKAECGWRRTKVYVKFSFTTKGNSNVVGFTSEGVEFTSSEKTRLGRKWCSGEICFDLYEGDRLLSFINENDHFAVHFPHLVPELAECACAL